MDFRTPRELDVLAITVDARALRDYADEVEHRDLDAEVPENRVLKTDADRREGLASLLESALATLDATPAVLGHRQAQDNLRESLLNRILGTLAPDCAGGRPHAHAGRQQLVARAKDYIREHLDQTLTVADLCKALNVSRRTLQYSFEEVLDLNPVRYLLALRLNGARRDLKSADPSSASVQDIAASWGFWHLSRFSHYYKGMFGELPSETLRARSAPAATAIPEVVPRTGLAGA
jgi:AraC family ethanolamine operon transcriptional activator